ncbi:hypothetical protein C3L33_00338, partial [Rhododendron williamsianum]
MALARLAFKNMGQRVASPSCYSLASQSLVNRSLDSAQKQRWGSDPPRGFSASSGDHHEKSDGREVAVSDRVIRSSSCFQESNARGASGGGTTTATLIRIAKDRVRKRVGASNREHQQAVGEFLTSRLIGRFKEHDECYKLRYLMPGLGKEDVKITVEDGVLRIRGEHKEVDEEESDDELFSAVRYGYYDFTDILPEDAKPDEIKAEMKDGVLTIIIPRTETPKKDVKEVQID